MNWTPEKVKALRTKTGLSQKAMAERLGVSLFTVCRWERGHHPPTGLYRKALDDLAIEVFT